jgi:release factor glutamine methyltransferase
MRSRPRSAAAPSKRRSVSESSEGPLTTGELLKRTCAYLTEKGCSSPRLDAELLLTHVLGVERIELYMALERPLSATELDALRPLVARRAGREPLQYILGEWGFRRLTLSVDPRALIPRPETEIVVERALARLAGLAAPRVLDVGTGSGAIALAVAHEHPGARVTAFDISNDALALARENVERTGLPVELVQGDLRGGLPAGPWDLIVSNPPYIDPREARSLQPEVVDWEPHIALFGPEVHHEVAAAARPVLSPGGSLVLEVGDDQAAHVSDELARLGYRDVAATLDLSGRNRVVEGTA